MTQNIQNNLPRLAAMPTPAKALITAILITLSFGMLGAMGQIIIHDIIPTFFSDQSHKSASDHHTPAMSETESSRGDLFSDMRAHNQGMMENHKPFYKSEHFVWTLKWTHIHIFGMNMIFIFLGTVTLFLNMSAKAKTWLIILPFVGVFFDIAAVWLKGYVSPAFFWLHIPGGGLFGIIFIFVFFKAMREMWVKA